MALGALAGLAAAMLLFLVLGISGIIDSPDDAVPLLFLQFLSLVAAGYVSGRIARRDPVLHGGFAGLAVFVVTTAITLATDPGSTNLPVIAFTGLIAATLGSAGGALARAMHG